MSERKPYGDEWQKEVMKNPKAIITKMLRDVAIERDEQNARNELFSNCLHRALLMWKEKHPDDEIWPSGDTNLAWLFEEYAALKARAENAEAILQRLEFIETDDGDKECPSCRFVEPSHAEDCELYAALKAGKHV